MSRKVAINGLGRIGRAALKLALEQPQLDVVAVNEMGSLENMVYLLRYDTVYGRYERQVDAVDGKLVIDSKPLVYVSERDPGQLPWADLEIAWCWSAPAGSPTARTPASSFDSGWYRRAK
jgi:glyceraldehyde 3-phosphate dehydrogenase